MVTNRISNYEGTETKKRMIHYIPKVNIREDEDALYMMAVLPGVKTEDLELTVEDDQLKIYGKTSFSEPESMKLYYSEFEAGDYERVFSLSSKIDREGIKAEAHDGILSVYLPKAKEAKPRRISIGSAAHKEVEVHAE